VVMWFSETCPFSGPPETFRLPWAQILAVSGLWLLPRVSVQCVVVRMVVAAVAPASRAAAMSRTVAAWVV
jgi:hypothetical protein